MARKLAVELVGDSRSLERAFARSSKAGKKWQGDLTRSGQATRSALAGIGTTVGVTLGTAGAVAGIKGMVNAASSLHEEIGKSAVIFGDATKAVLDWSQTTANAFGISQSAALAAASNFGGMFAQIGKGEQQAASMSRTMVELAGDLASFFDVSTSDALEKLRSGLSGEAEPLRKFNVFLDEGKVKAEAYRSGIARAGAVLTAGQKIQARYNLILRETGPAHGNAAATAGSWANVQRRIGALVTDNAAKIGTLLLPKLEELGGRFAAWINDTRNQARVAGALGSAIGTVAGAIATVSGVVATVADAVGGWKNAITIAIGAWVGFQIAGVGAAAAVSTANIVAANVTKNAWRAALITTGWGALAVAAGIAAAFVITHWETVKRWFREFWLWLEHTANEAALKVVEPFSHIPSDKLGGWARDLKEAIKENMKGIEQDAADLAGQAGEKSGESWAEKFERQFRDWMRKAAKLTKQQQQKIPPLVPPVIPKPQALTGTDRAQRRNQVFDTKVARQLDRLQDLSLRKQLARLREIAREIRDRMAVTRDLTRRLNLEDKLLEVLRQQRSVQGEIANSVKAANQALKERADAIKSAVLDRLQQRQTDVLNKRALADAKEQLRIAKQTGGPKGIQAALRGLQDVRFEMQRAQIERAPARLTPGGQFALGGVVTINVHGVTDPNAVASKVAEVLQRRRKRTAARHRGPNA